MQRSLAPLALTGLLGLLAACSGGLLDSASTATSVSGHMAVGAAVQNASITLYDVTGKSVSCPLTDSSTAAYSCTTTGMSSPFLLLGTGVYNGTSVTLSSATTSANGTANITPVTDAVVAAAVSSAGGNSTQIQSSPVSALTALASNTSALAQAKTAYLALLSNTIAKTGKITDPISDALLPGDTGNAMDNLLDAVQITSNPDGSISITSVGSSSSLIIAAGTSAASVSAITPPAAGDTITSDLKSAIKTLAGNFTACFNSTLAQRAGNTPPSACNNIFVDNVSATLLSGVPSHYLANGNDAEGAFGDWYQDETMDGASFAVPQIVKVLSSDSSGNPTRAWITLSWVRTSVNGAIPEATDTVIQLVTSKTSSDSGWRLVGNQRAIRSKVAYIAEERLYLNPKKAPTYDATSGNADVLVSQLQVQVGQTDINGVSTDLAVVTGPGLPANGLLLMPSTGVCSNNIPITAQLVSGDITGDDVSVAAGKYSKLSTCANRFRIAGVAVDASKSIKWPSNNRAWLKPTEATPDFSQMQPFTHYLFRIYQNGNTSTPAYTYTVQTRTGAIAPSALRTYSWQALSAATQATLIPTSSTASTGASSNFPLTWTNAIGIAPVTGANVQITDASLGTIEGVTGALRPQSPGTTVTVNVPAPSAASFPAVTALPANGFTFAQITSVMIDGQTFATAYEYDK